MILHPTTINELLEGKTQYIVPIYQRNYDWRVEQSSKLLEDIRMISDLKYPRHHFGVMYYFEEKVAPGDIRKCNIVDGQQRITTISILFKSILDHIRDNNICEDLVDDIKGYLVSRHKGNLFNKLILKKNDNEVYTLLLSDDTKKINDNQNMSESNIFKNYNHFRNELMKLSSDDVYEIYNNISALEISSHLCEKDKDDPQTIFQNINSSGKPLTPSNLIMNYSLQYLNEDEMRYAYESYWSPIETAITDEKELEDFVRSFITIKLLNNPKKGKVYDDYKKIEGEQIVIIKELYGYSNYYGKIYQGLETNKRIRNLFNDGLNDTSYLKSFLLYLYNDYEYGIISDNDFVEILLFLRNYITRRNVYFSKSRDLIPLFCELMSLLEVIKEQNSSNYFEEIKAYFILLRKDDSKIPTDEEVKKALMDNKDFYKSLYCKKILLNIERYNSKELIDSDGLSIEHILPQNPIVSQAWRDELGSDYLGIKERRCHNLGNLTLTGYNSELSDKSFTDKKTMVNGLNESKLNLNRYFRDIDKWTESQIIDRCEKLSTTFNLVYSYPTINEDLLETYKTREIERITYFDKHKELYDYLINALDFRDVRKEVFTNRVVFDNLQIKFNKKSIIVSDIEDDEVRIAFRNIYDVDRWVSKLTSK